MFNDYSARFRQSLLNRSSAYLAAAAGSLALVASVGRADVAKTVGLTAATIASAVALANHRQALYDADITQDHETALQLRRQRELLTGAPNDAARDATSSGVSLFDWSELARDRTRYPAIFVSGKPGAGKTTLAEWLGAIAGVGKRYVISPHLKPSDFHGFDGYYGAGANFFQPEDLENESIEVSALSRESSVFAAMNAFTNLVYSRLIDYSKGVETFEPIDLYIDETIAINLFFKRRCPVKSLKNSWSNFLAMLLTEPRKVGLRVWLLTQVQTVSAMGLEGFNELKGEMIWIRLNHNAVNHAKKLRRSKSISDAEYFWLTAQPRPILVDEFLAAAPSLLEQRAAIAAAAAKTVDAVGSAADEAIDAYAVTEDGTSHAALQDNGLGDFGTTADDENEEEIPAKTPQMHEGDAVGDRVENAADVVGISVSDVAAFYDRAYRVLGKVDDDGKRWTKTRIVSEVWSGLPRQKARLLFDTLFPDYQK